MRTPIGVDEPKSSARDVAGEVDDPGDSLTGAGCHSPSSPQSYDQKVRSMILRMHTACTCIKAERRARCSTSHKLQLTSASQSPLFLPAAPDILMLPPWLAGLVHPSALRRVIPGRCVLVVSTPGDVASAISSFDHISIVSRKCAYSLRLQRPEWAVVRPASSRSVLSVCGPMQRVRSPTNGCVAQRCCYATPRMFANARCDCKHVTDPV